MIEDENDYVELYAESENDGELLKAYIGNNFIEEKIGSFNALIDALFQPATLGLETEREVARNGNTRYWLNRVGASKKVNSIGTIRDPFQRPIAWQAGNPKLDGDSRHDARFVLIERHGEVAERIRLFNPQKDHLKLAKSAAVVRLEFLNKGMLYTRAWAAGSHGDPLTGNYINRMSLNRFSG